MIGYFYKALGAHFRRGRSLLLLTVLGVALGFGAQTLVKDIMSGIFILTENQIADFVRHGCHLASNGSHVQM